MGSSGRNRLFRYWLIASLAGFVVWSSAAEAAPPASGSRARRQAITARKIHSSAPDDRDARRTLQRALENYKTILKVIANNIANAETPAYKRSQVLLADDDYEEEAEPGEQDAASQESPAGLSVGTGSRVAATQIDFRQGRLQRTGRQWDLAIVGDGFFQVKDASGAIYHCRAGQFCLNATGQIVVEAADSCRVLEPAIVVPHNATGIMISSDGALSWRTPDSSTLQQAGTIQFAKFLNPQGLRRIGENLYADTDGCGTAQVGSPGENGIGKLRQGWIEESNVDLAEEIAEWKRVRRICRELRKLLEEK